MDLQKADLDWQISEAPIDQRPFRKARLAAPEGESSELSRSDSRDAGSTTDPEDTQFRRSSREISVKSGLKGVPDWVVKRKQDMAGSSDDNVPLRELARRLPAQPRDQLRKQVKQNRSHSKKKTLPSEPDNQPYTTPHLTNFEPPSDSNTEIYYDSQLEHSPTGNDADHAMRSDQSMASETQDDSHMALKAVTVVPEQTVLSSPVPTQSPLSSPTLIPNTVLIAPNMPVLDERKKTDALVQAIEGMLSFIKNSN